MLPYPFIPDFLLNLRSPTLTTFFKIFPIFCHPTFLIALITLGFWLLPHKKCFFQLAFLIPISSILNPLLKLYFSLPRPPTHLHLIPTTDQLGFPSGDAQLASLFWAFISLSFKSPFIKIFSISIILLVPLSRLYLGVHSLQDVLAGLLIGLLSLALWLSPFLQKLPSAWQKNQKKSLTFFTLALSSSLLLFPNPPDFPHLFYSIGALLGLCLCHFQSPSLTHTPPSKKSLLLSLSSLSLIIIISSYFHLPLPSSPYFPYLAILKFSSIFLLAFALFPKLHSLLITKNPPTAP